MTTLGETWINIRPRIVDGEKFVEEVHALLVEAFGGVHTVDVTPSAEPAPTPVAADSLTPAPEPEEEPDEEDEEAEPGKEDEESESKAAVRRRRTREQIAQDKESGRDDEFKQLLADHPDWSIDMIRHKMYGPQLAATADPTEPEDVNEADAPNTPTPVQTPEPVRAPEPVQTPAPVMPPPAPWAAGSTPQQPAERPKAPWEP